MKKGFLESLGIDADIIKQIQEEVGKDISALKGQITTLNDDIAAKDVIIGKRDARIGELEKIDVEDIKKQEFERGKQEGTAELAQFKFNSAVDAELSKSGAKNTKALRGLLDMEKVKYENDTLSGLTEQLESIKAENGYLFGDEPSKPSFAAGVTPSGAATAISQSDFDKMGYKARVELLNTNPDAYNQLTGKGE